MAACRLLASGMQGQAKEGLTFCLVLLKAQGTLISSRDPGLPLASRGRFTDFGDTCSSGLIWVENQLDVTL